MIYMDYDIFIVCVFISVDAELPNNSGPAAERAVNGGECQLTFPADFQRRQYCGGPSVGLGWFCYQAIHGELVDLSLNVTCPPDNLHQDVRLGVTLSTLYNSSRLGPPSSSLLANVQACSVHTHCFIDYSQPSYIGHGAHIYTASAERTESGKNEYIEALAKVDVKYEKKNLTWLVTDDRFWYHIRGDNLHIGANAEATSYPSPDRYTLTTDNNTILMDHNDTYKTLSFDLNISLLEEAQLTLTVYARSLEPISRSITVPQVNIISSTHIPHESDSEEYKWIGGACVLISAIVVTGIVHIYFLCQAKRCSDRSAASGTQTQVTIDIQLPSSNPNSNGALPREPDDIEFGEHAPSSLSDTSSLPSNIEYDDLSTDCHGDHEEHMDQLKETTSV